MGLISTPSSFWVKVLCTKYSIDHENLPPEFPLKTALIFGSLLGKFGIKCFEGSVGPLVKVRKLGFGGMHGFMMERSWLNI